MNEAWTEICKLDDITPNSGRAALVNGKQIAIFRVRQADNDAFYALDNHCPFAGANVLSRGIIGSLGQALVVASPIYKQHFCLETGQCLEDGSAQLATWQVRLDGDSVQLAE